MGPLTFAAIGIGTAAVLLIVLFLLMKARKSTQGRPWRRARRASGREMPGDVCGICFGTISKTDMTAKCSCGQAFHNTCAGPTGNCPYCGAPYGRLVVEAPDLEICPACGADVVGNVCTCGAVINRDGAFICECGGTLDVNDPVCGKCGKEYDVCMGRREKGA